MRTSRKSCDFSDLFFVCFNRTNRLRWSQLDRQCRCSCRLQLYQCEPFFFNHEKFHFFLSVFFKKYTCLIAHLLWVFITWDFISQCLFFKNRSFLILSVFFFPETTRNMCNSLYIWMLKHVYSFVFGICRFIFAAKEDWMPWWRH
jgi:hypothetical protein